MKPTSFRTPAAIFAAGAALVVALTLAVAPTAHADDLWGAIATGENGHWAISVGEANEIDAANVATGRCGADCRVRLQTVSCGAIALNKGRDFYVGRGSTRDQAAYDAVTKSYDSKIVTSMCSNPPDSGPTSWR